MLRVSTPPLLSLAPLELAIGIIPTPASVFVFAHARDGQGGGDAVGETRGYCMLES